MIKRNNECNNEFGKRILRNNHNFKQIIQLKNHYGEATFSHFFVNFIKNMIFNDSNCNLEH